MAELKVKLTAETKQAERQVSDFGKKSEDALSGLESVSKVLNEILEAINANTKSTSDSIDSLSKSISNINPQPVESVAESISDVATQIGNVSVATKDAENKIEDFSKSALSAFDNAGDEIFAGISDALQEAGISFQEFEQLLKDSGKTIEEFSAEISKAALNSEGFENALKGVDANSKPLSAQLRQIKNEISQLEQSGQTGSKSFQDLQIAAAKLQDQIGDTNARIKALASDTANLDAVIGAVQGLASAGQVAAGAFALFGNANENVFKTLVKLQGALSLAQGAQQLLNTINKDSIVVLKAQQLAQRGNAAATVAATSIMRSLGIATTATSASFQVLKGAIIATGLGALAVVIGVVVNKLMEIKSVASDSDKELDKLNRTAKQTGENFSDSSELLKQLTASQINNINATNSQKAAYDSLNSSFKTYIENLGKQEIIKDLLPVYNRIVAAATEAQKQIERIDLGLELFDPEDEAKERARLNAIIENTRKQVLNAQKTFEKIGGGTGGLANILGIKEVEQSAPKASRAIKQIADEVEKIKPIEKLEFLPIGSIAQLNQEIAALKRQQELTFDPVVFQNYAREIDKVTAKIKEITGEVSLPGIEDGSGTTLLAQIFGEPKDIKEIQDQIIGIGQSIAGAFEGAFSAIADGESPIKAITNTIKQLVVRLLAAAAAAAILSALLPGGQAAALGGFKGILGGILGGGRIPGFASGGVATRPTLGVFGEAGPEAVIPLSQLANIIGNAGGGGATTVTGSIRGNEIYLTNQRAGASYSRLFG
jgi:hypothetical protein